MTRILHIADVHLDRPFVGLAPSVARERRRDLMSALRGCIREARERSVDLITVGGDLWESENVTADARNGVAQLLAGAEIQVALICGNHDPNLPGGHYERTEWPSNVHVFADAEPSQLPLSDTSIWGVSWTGGVLTADFLESFRAPDDGRSHILLLHGTATTVPTFAEEAICPFHPEKVRQAGFTLCLAGHIHGGSYTDGVVYPGSPEPLSWSETGRHCYAIVELGEGEPVVELMDANRRRYDTAEVNCEGADSQEAIRGAVAAALEPQKDPGNLLLHVKLTGEIDPACEIDVAALHSEASKRFAALRISDATVPGYDLDALAVQRSAVGKFVQRLQARIAQAPDGEERETLRLALLAGLRAMDGREKVLDVD